jgi:hypothetical protein
MYEFKEGTWRIGGNYLCSRLFSSLKLPVGRLDFLRKSPCCLGCGAQERCVRPDTKKAIYRPYLCVTSDVFWLRMSHVGCANRLGKKRKKENFYRMYDMVDRLNIYQKCTCSFLGLRLYVSICRTTSCTYPFLGLRRVRIHLSDYIVCVSISRTTLCTYPFIGLHCVRIHF